MEFVVQQSRLRGTVDVPGSKSHTIRGVLCGSLAAGRSVLHRPLASADTQAAVSVYGALGARFDLQADRWVIEGTGGQFRVPGETLDTLNSGTTTNCVLGSLSLLPPGVGPVRLTGDEQIQRRSSAPLVQALNDLGAQITAERGNGCAPFRIAGTLRGGHATMEAKSSQYVTSLLLACPLAAGDTELTVPLLHEKPYVRMTLDWLKFQGLRETHDEGLRQFRVPGGQRFRAFERRIPADFSTATFFLVAGALGENAITCRGLDLSDQQSDKAVVEFLRAMGARVTVAGDAISVAPGDLRGIAIDLNDCPDALPMMAVAGCFARGTTRLENVPQARMKETDRIAVMCAELRKLGGDVEELPDGLVIRESRLHAAAVAGHGDHRVVMALAVAATRLAGATRISTAEAAAVTVPEFAAIMQNLGADLATGPAA